MPKLLTHIDWVTIHPGESGISTVSVWFTENRTQHERVTFSPFDLFDYRLFCSRVLEVTGHPFSCREIEEATDEWRAEMRWREIINNRLGEASVEPVACFHWKPLIT